jgi:predicted transcriptional regulator
VDAPIRIDPKDQVVELTVNVVTAYVSNNPVTVSELPLLIADVRAALARSLEPSAAGPPLLETRKPAVALKKSVEQGCITCLEDGLQFRSLRRHLMTRHHMTPEEYRERWQLPASYPMVAPGYAETRSKLAKRIGLGRKNRKQQDQLD